MPSGSTPAHSVTRARRSIVLVIGPLAAVIVLRPVPSAFDAPKLAVVQLGAALLLGLGIIVWASIGARPGPGARWRFADVAAVSLGAAFVVSTLAAPDVRASVWGFYPRSAGLLFYLSMLVYWWTASRLRWQSLDLAMLFRFVVGGSVPVLLYAIVQGLGADPFVWAAAQFSGASSTMGNPNFVAGFVGMSASISLAATMAFRGLWRWVAASSLLMSGPVLFFASSTQGAASLAAGFLAFGVLTAIQRRAVVRGPQRRHWTLILTGYAVAAAAGVLAAVSVGSAQIAQGLLERRLLYATALALSTERPVFGHGLDAFGRQFLPNRPLEHAQLVGDATADAIHSVPLSLLHGGGAVLLCAYVAFVLATGVLLLKAIQNTDQVLLVGGVGGAWVAYHVQSLVSIENPAIAVMHYVFAGVIASVAWSGTWELERERASRRGRARGIRASAPVALAVGLAVTISLGWMGSRPLRAELAVGRAATEARSGDLPGAQQAFERSHRIAPEIGEYYLAHASVLEQAGHPDEALSVLERGVSADTSSGSYASVSALIAQQLGRTGRAGELHELALQIDPLNPVLLFRAGQFLALQGRTADAVGLLERAVLVEAEDASLWVLLGDLHRDMGDDRAAQVAYAAALELDPDDEFALEGQSAVREE